MKILAVDYGDSRTGLATCDRTEFLTSPITPQITVKARDKVAARVCEVAKEIEAELIVIGLPLNMDGTAGGQTQKVREFCAQLEKLGLTVYYQDERLTTVTAERTLIDGNMHRRERKQVVDKVAAVVILQSWLDAQASQTPEETEAVSYTHLTLPTKA